MIDNILMEDLVKFSICIHTEEIYEGRSHKNVSSDCRGGWGDVTQGHRMRIQERHLFICA